jgi:hypothetical protein
VLVVAGVLAVVGAITFITGTVAPAFDHLRFGFPAYYTSARLATDGDWSSDVYDDAWFSARSLELTDGRIREIYRPNTPVMSLLAVPVAGFDVITARRIWLVLDLVLVALAYGALLAAIPALRSPPVALAVGALFLWWSPLREQVGLGQAYALMLALQAIAVWAMVRDRPGVTGAALGVAAATKLAALPLLLLLAVRRSWRAVAVATGVAVALALFTLGFAGLDGWVGFGRAVVADVTQPPAFLSVTSFQSLTGLVDNLLVPDARWNPNPLAMAPTLATVIVVGLSAAALVITLWLGRRGRVDVAAAAAITAGILVLDLAQEYHFAVLLIPAAIAIGAWLDAEEQPLIDAAWLVGAIILLAAPLAYEDPGLDGGLSTFLAYPRLYGAWLLWAWLIRRLWLERSADRSAVASAAVTMDAGPRGSAAPQPGEARWPSSSSSN